MGNIGRTYRGVFVAHLECGGWRQSTIADVHGSCETGLVRDNLG